MMLKNSKEFSKKENRLVSSSAKISECKQDDDVPH